MVEQFDSILITVGIVGNNSNDGERVFGYRQVNIGDIQGFFQRLKLELIKKIVFGLFQ